MISYRVARRQSNSSPITAKQAAGATSNRLGEPMATFSLSGMLLAPFVALLEDNVSIGLSDFS